MLLQLFPLWALLISAVAYFQPLVFTDFKWAIIPLLMVIMMCMGLSLKIRDFNRVLVVKKAVALGVLLQFTVMPVAACLIAKLFSLDMGLTLGLLLVGSVAGGTASNVMCYLARGDVALSISMTAISTLLSVVLTPFAVGLLADENVQVPISDMVMSLVQVILIPVMIGVAFNRYFEPVFQKCSKALPVISMFAILLIIAVVVALNADNAALIEKYIILAVLLHNLLGLLVGYHVSVWMGFEQKICRTIAFEVGLQNSGLATALAIKYFTPSAAIPGAIFSICHNLSGSALAGYWRQKVIPEIPER